MGRVVITHSTYIDGLIPLLRRLAQVPGIDTVTPAVINMACSSVAAGTLPSVVAAR